MTPAEPETSVRKNERGVTPPEHSNESRLEKQQEQVPERPKEQWRLSKPEKEISPVTELDLRPVKPQQTELPKEPESIQQRKTPAQEALLKPKLPKPKEETVRKQTDTILQPRSRTAEAVPPVRQKTGPRLSIGKITVEMTAPAKSPGTVQTKVVYRSQPAAADPAKGAGLRYNSRFGLSQI